MNLLTRRGFLNNSARSGILLITTAGESLPRVSAADSTVDDLVRFSPQFEPTVQFLEQTDRDSIIEATVARIRGGLGYRELVGALLLAGVRNIPGSSAAGHRNVGGGLHSIFAIHSAHVASVNSADRNRWLPILWAVDRFKLTHQGLIRPDLPRTNWRMNRIDGVKIPSGQRARRAFTDAMENWDERAADVAAAGLFRSCGEGEIMNWLTLYAIRDYRYIGHKLIYVANACRTLQTFGWHHGEPVIRSLARSLTAYYHDRGHPSQTDQVADRSWRRNLEDVKNLRGDWQSGTVQADACRELLSVLREGQDRQACRTAIALLNGKVSPRSIWDAVICSVNELLVSKPDFNTLHAVTSLNAIHYLYQACGADQTRRMAMLQAVSLAVSFRSEFISDPTDSVQIDRIQPHELQTDGPDAITEILAELHNDREVAAGKTLQYLDRGGDPSTLIARMRSTVCHKAVNPHDYKLWAAVEEDYWQVSPSWRRYALMAYMHMARSPSDPDSAVARRIQAALA